MAQTKLDETTDRRIDALLALLTDNAMIVISGSKIAREIGVTRFTVWRWIEKLRGLGVRVKGHPRSGYQIEKVPDVLVRSSSASVCIRARSASASTISSRRIRQTPSPCGLGNRASLTELSSLRRNRRPGADEAGTPGIRKKQMAYI